MDNEYDNMTTTELWNLARKRNIPDYSHMWPHELKKLFQEQDRQKDLEPLYNEARKRGIQGYMTMSKKQLERALQPPAREAIEWQGETNMAASRGRPKKTTSSRGTKKRTAAKKTAGKSRTTAKKTTKKKPVRRTTKETSKPRTRTRTRKKSNPAEAAAAELIDYVGAGQRLAKQALKTKGITLADLNIWKNSAIQKNQLTGARREEFLKGWMSVVKDYIG